jgi:hypothetical protein
MDYTIIGSEVNLAARLESHAELGEILIAHETYSLVKDTVSADEQPPISVKGFAKPIRSYKIIGLNDESADQDRVIRVDTDGMRIALDLDRLTTEDRAHTIETIENILSRLKD